MLINRSPYFFRKKNRNSFRTTNFSSSIESSIFLYVSLQPTDALRLLSKQSRENKLMSSV
ncbi:unnamed protein product [Brassica oleracea var. botrytis]